MQTSVAAMDDVQMRIEPPTAGTEAELLLASLDRQRAIFAWKTGGLDAAGLRATTAASTMTLGGLIKHLALVEDDMFSQKVLGQPAGPPWDAIDWDDDPDWEWRTAATVDTPEQLYALWNEAVARSRAAVAEAVAGDGFDALAKGLTDVQGAAPNLRRMVVDMIEEYARHIGHADLLRESVDGLVGEDPPR
jgi:hypothetical protein